MNYIILVLAMISIWYVVFKIRRFDYFTVLVISTVVYYFPTILGRIRSSQNLDLTAIDINVYVCVAVFMILLLLFIATTDKYKILTGGKPLFKVESSGLSIYEDMCSNYAAILLGIVGLVLMAYTFIMYGGISGQFNKMLLLAESNRFTEYFKYIALYSFVYAFINKGKGIFFLRVMAIILIGYTFLLGHRSFIVLGLIGIFMCRLGNGKRVRLATFIGKHKTAFLTIIIGAFFFLFIKGVFAALMSGQYELVKSRLTDPDYYINALLTSESNSITLNLNRVCFSGMAYSFIDYMVGFVMLIPVLGSAIASTTGYVSFETTLNQTFNTQLSEGVGLASTFLGESYAVGGIFAEVIIVVLTLIFIMWLQNKLYSTKNNLTATYISVLLPYFAFYIHRNSLIFLLITARAYLYIWLLVWVFKSFVKALGYRQSYNTSAVRQGYKRF